MKKIATSVLLFGILLSFCKIDNTRDEDAYYWKLGWRMVENSILEDHQLSSEQFDSLRVIRPDMSYNFMAVGLQSLSEIGEIEKVNELLLPLELGMKTRLCGSEHLQDQKGCKDIPKPVVKNKVLQMKILKMYSMDQSVRGNVMEDFIRKHRLDTIDYEFSCDNNVDLNNQCILKEVIEEYGFPSVNLIGKDALRGVFMIIQHADRNIEWQKEQLLYIKAAVLKGELDARKYAYLYDRIQMNAKLPQLYGTQFSSVGVNEATLYNVHNEEELDFRRMEIGLMPIDIYIRLMIKTVSQ